MIRGHLKNKNREVGGGGGLLKQCQCQLVLWNRNWENANVWGGGEEGFQPSLVGT
jgi:hypothetical protein